MQRFSLRRLLPVTAAAMVSTMMFILAGCDNPVNPLGKTNAAVPHIISQPKDTTVKKGDVVTLSVTAAVPSDGGELSYQWYSSASASNTGGTAIAGETDASYTYTVPQNAAGMYYYYAAVTNTNSEADGKKTAVTASNAAKVTVILDGFDPDTDWQDDNVEHDERLITINDNTVWVDVNRAVGMWLFSDHEAEKRYPGSSYGDYQWHTYENKLYLEEKYRENPRREIYQYAISGSGVLTLTNSGGAEVQFQKISRDDLIPDIPGNAGHDPQLVTSAKGDTQVGWHRSISGAEITFLHLHYDDEGEYEPWGQMDRIRSSTDILFEEFNTWYTIGNQLHLVNHMGSITVYTYTVSSNGNTLTLTGNGETLTFQKGNTSLFLSQLQPAVITNGARDPALLNKVDDDGYYWTGEWDNGDMEFRFLEGGLAVFEDYYPEKIEIYWWRTDNGNIYLHDFVNGNQLRTIAYQVSANGETLTLIENGKTIVLYERDDGSGGGGKREFDVRLILDSDYLWYNTVWSTSYQFNDNGKGVSTFYNLNSGWISPSDFDWYTSSGFLYIDYSQIPYTVSADGNTLTLEGEVYTKTHIKDIIGEVDERLILDGIFIWNSIDENGSHVGVQFTYSGTMYFYSFRNRMDSLQYSANAGVLYANAGGESIEFGSYTVSADGNTLTLSVGETAIVFTKTFLVNIPDISDWFSPSPKSSLSKRVYELSKQQSNAVSSAPTLQKFKAAPAKNLNKPAPRKTRNIFGTPRERTKTETANANKVNNTAKR